MALKICPDCGRKVSSRADHCPECGCPAEFFEDLEPQGNADGHRPEPIEEQAAATAEPEETAPAPVIPETVQEVPALASFNILGTRISYPESTATYIELLRKHQDDALRFIDVLEDAYDKAGNIDKAWKDVVVIARAQTEVVIKDNIRSLYGLGCSIGKEYFTENGADIEPRIESALKRYKALLGAASDLSEQRMYERANRSKWTGGGFGIRGAIKGAAKAGAMNAVTGLGRAIGDSAVNSSDKALIEKKKKELYGDKTEIKSLSIGLYQVITLADYLTAALYGAGDPRTTLDFELFKAFNAYNAAVDYESSPASLAHRCVDILEVYPMVTGAYTKILSFIPSGDYASRKEVFDMIRFWNLGYFFRNDLEAFTRIEKVQDFLEANPAAAGWESRFRACSFETYGKAKSELRLLKKSCGEDCLNYRHPYTDKLAEFFDLCGKCDVFRGHLKELNGLENAGGLDAIVSALRGEREYLPGLLKGIWMKGDEKAPNASKLLAKYKLPQDEDILIYKNSALFGTLFGGDGYIITGHYVCDLKSGTILAFSSDTAVIKKGGGKLCICEAAKEITVDLKGQDALSRGVMAEVLREGRNIGCAPGGGAPAAIAAFEAITDLIHDYAETNKIEDEEGLLEDFFTRHGVEVGKPANENAAAGPSAGAGYETAAPYMPAGNISQMTAPAADTRQTAMMYCAFCGKQIKRTQKFCNYCGCKTLTSE